MSKSNNIIYRNVAILIVVFLVIGMMLGSNLNQVYTGTSVTGADTVELTNNGNLDTKVRDFSLTSGDYSAVSDSSGTVSTFSAMSPVTISHSGVLTDYQFKTTILYDSEMQADFDDVRFASSAGAHIPYWIESKTDSNTADVWIKSDLLDGDTTVLMYYGNDGLSSGSSGGDVFIQFKPQTTSTDFKMSNVDLTPASHKIIISYTSVTPEINSCIGVTEVALWTDDDIYTTVNDDSSFVQCVRNDGSYTQENHAISNPTTNIYKFVYTSSQVIFYRDDVEYDTITTNVPDEDMGLAAKSLGSNIWNYGFISKDTITEPIAMIGAEQHRESIDQGISVGDDKLYYDGTLSSTLTYSDGSAYIDSTDVSASMKGDLPIIKVDTTQNIKIDHDLEYSITYIPKNMDVTSPGMFHAGEDMRVDTRLTDTSGNPTSYQPLEMRIRLFDSNDRSYLDEIVSSTSFVIPGKYLHDNKHYQLRLSYEGYEFGGWSNEILADFDIGTEGYTITSSPDKAPEGIAAASFAAVEGLVGMAVTGWLDVPIIGDIIRFIADLVGVEL